MEAHGEREGEKGEERLRMGLGGLLGVGVALLGLTALTYGLSRLQHGAWSLPVALGLSGAKAVLIALFYMHLVEERTSHGLVVGTAVFFVALLLLLCVLEVSTRFPPVVPPGPFRPLLLPGLEEPRPPLPP